jgi:2'-5' RNA ligase
MRSPSWFTVLPFLLGLGPDPTLPHMTFDPALLQTAALPVMTDAASTHMAMTVPDAPVDAVRRQVEAATGLRLIDPGEAHVTVVTPPEFAVLGRLLTMAEIHALAADLQETSFEVVCVGRGQNGERQTFFLVVRSAGLVSIRRDVAALFRERGGSPEAFDPDHYYPHVTLGFTHVDLHEADGVIKDGGSCVAPVREER